MKIRILLVVATTMLTWNDLCVAEIKVTTERHEGESAQAGFKFNQVPLPSKTDAATKAKFAIVDGQPDGNGGDVSKLQDGKVPSDADQPSENFFFRQGTDGGRIQVDLGGRTTIKQVNTYSALVAE
jgi:hypothetical protein